MLNFIRENFWEIFDAIKNLIFIIFGFHTNCESIKSAEIANFQSEDDEHQETTSLNSVNSSISCSSEVLLLNSVITTN